MTKAYMQMATSLGACGDGTTASTPAAVEINLGFKPKYVKVVVIDTTCAQTEWIQGMTAAKGVHLKVDAAAISFAELGADGITVSARGFTIGTAAQVASKKYHWVALG